MRERQLRLNCCIYYLHVIQDSTAATPKRGSFGAPGSRGLSSLFNNKGQRQIALTTEHPHSFTIRKLVDVHSRRYKEDRSVLSRHPILASSGTCSTSSSIPVAGCLPHVVAAPCHPSIGFGRHPSLPRLGRCRLLLRRRLRLPPQSSDTDTSGPLCDHQS